MVSKLGEEIPRELAVFEDMTKNAAFDDAVKGLDCQYLFVFNTRISVFLIHPTFSSYSAHNHSVRRSSAGCTLKGKELGRVVGECKGYSS